MRFYRLFLAALLLILIAAPAAAQDETAAITFPTPLSELFGVVEITGTVNLPNVQSYFFEVSDFLSDPASTTWLPVTLPSNAIVTDGVLAQWDTRVLPTGVYALRLRVFLTTGEIVEVLVRPIVVDNSLAPVVEAEPTPEPTPTVVPRPNVVSDLPIPVGGQMDTFDDDAVAFMQQAGMTWMKWQIPFVIGDSNLINVARDRINYAHENGFFALLSIKGNKDDLRELGADYYPLLAEFMGTIATLQPDAIQVWNEQNLDREWPNGRINPASYTEMLRQAYEAIKAVDPQIRVITGAPAPTGAEGFFGQNAVWNDDRYYLGMANAGAARYADCIGIHYNEGILPPSAQGGDPRGEYPTYYFQQMIQRAFFPFRLNGADIPLCFSELGYLSPDGYGALPSGFAWGANTSVAEQAQWLRDAILLASQSTSPRVELIIVFNVNFTRFIDGDPQGGYAIIRPDGSCPACETIASLRGTP
ncbi:hypothetical protein FBR02_13200 [Anaerolineae bacterium CFX9]|nr:hypothetical protein [Anaerolineae bacterium CFX9]